MICLLAQDCVFEEAEAMFEQFLGISVSGKQMDHLKKLWG